MTPCRTVGQLHDTPSDIHARQFATSEGIKLNDVPPDRHCENCLCGVECSGLSLLGSLSNGLQPELACCKPLHPATVQ